MSRESDSSFRNGSEPEEPKTETTLTTRVRINIPGSRPIPPVVVRKPVDPAAADSATARGSDATDAAAAPEDPKGPSSGDSTGSSSWFAPRKAPAGGNGQTRTPPGGTPTGGARTEPPANGTPAFGTGADGSGRTERPGGRPAPLPRRTPPSGPTSGPATGDMPSLPPGFQQTPGPPGNQPPGSHPEPTVPPVLGPPPGSDITGIMKPPTPPGDTQNIPVVPPGPEARQPADPFAPGVSGAPVDEAPRDPFAPGDGPRDPFAPGGGTRQDPFAPGGEGPRDPFASGPRDPFDGGPFGGSSGAVASPATGGPSATGPATGGPAVPPPGPGVDQRRREEPESEPEPFTFSEPDPPARKGRSKLVLLGVAAAGVAGIAYGAGLLLDHSDIPNGTTVLGVDIGGSTQQEAVSKLNAALGSRTTDPLVLEVDGAEQQLKPSVAGLSLDTDETVRGATGRDYNPISVIASLVGGTREAQPVFKVDEEKLRAALTELAGSGGTNSAQDGMVRFEDGKPVAVPGKASMAVDADRAAATVEAAYRQRAATGRDGAVTLPVSKQEPKVTQAEFQRAIKEFGEPAMSGWVWLKAGAVEVPFSQRTIGEFLTMRPAGNGRLQPVVDPEALAAKYGTLFDGVMIDAGTGLVPMTPKHAASAMTKALAETAPPEPQRRYAVVEGATQG
ncbi:hypothetical protein [Streptomyces alkaliterrae]|uniref:Peptidoglycan binding domain-containing protein n=1 Tax=Streptomyces alkaliterrae TaxID=2213162 RepID=A0A7W3WTD9_9ACTN|nr:hypothetical protein [Streptomyces alkaliterrae]MBB1258168.1 hypothetical protein [Streptomyces alkaliterrae]